MTNQLPISFLMIIIIVTVLVSLNAFSKSLILDKMVYSPYRVKHEKEYYRLISHMFIHADSVHLIFNMMSLYFLGSFLENELIFSFGSIGGEVHFLILYFFGGLFSTFSRNQDNFNYRALGASGAVSAVIFAAIIWNPTMKLSLLFLPIPIPAYIFGPIYLAFEYWADRRGGTGIAHDAHIGGAIFGVIYVLIINIDKGKEFLSVIFG
jgi:membrane associated rhomboid family serine protease